MQSVSSRIWTRVAVSISYDDNNYTTGTSVIYTPDIQVCEKEDENNEAKEYENDGL